MKINSIKDLIKAKLENVPMSERKRWVLLLSFCVAFAIICKTVYSFVNHRQHSTVEWIDSTDTEKLQLLNEELSKWDNTITKMKDMTMFDSIMLDSLNISETQSSLIK